MADPSIRDLAGKVDDLARLVARQAGLLVEISDTRRRPGPDIALLVDLHALRSDAMAAAAVTRSARERNAFEAIAAGLERLLAGRGGVLVVPRPGHPFSSATMEAAEEVSCADASLDRTVAALVAPGLEAEGRTLRPAKVAVNRYTPQAAEPETPAPPVDEVRTNGRRPATADTTVRKARSARNGRPTSKTEPEASTVTDTPPAKRTRRKQPAKTQPKAQPTSAMTSSETSASSETRI